MQVIVYGQRVNFYDKDNNVIMYMDFVPSGNGVYAKNTDTNSTLQNDFINRVYRKLPIK